MNLDDIKKKYTEEEIKRIKEEAEEIDFCVGTNLEYVVLYLENRRRNGDIYLYTNFNGEKLYSIDVTMNNAFKKCTGVTRKTWLKKEEKWEKENKEKIERWKKEAEENLPNWISEGQLYIHPEKFEEWKNTCIKGARGDYHGLEIKHALRLMKLLEDKLPLDYVKAVLETQGHSGMSFTKTVDIILHFSKRGPAFYNYVYRNNLNKYEKKNINKIKELNKRLKNGEKYEHIKNSLKEHKILDMCIKDNSNNQKLFEGTVLVNDDGSFEGYLKYDTYVKGKIFDQVISFAAFCNYKKLSQYTAIKQEDKYIGEKDVYYIDRILNDKEISISLKESNMDFEDELSFESKLEVEREFFDDDIKAMYDWYTYNEKREISNGLKRLKNNLMTKFNSSLNKRIESLSEPFAVPYNKPYIVNEEGLKQILDSKVDEDTANSIKENAKKFEENNQKVKIYTQKKDNKK